jgi:hypothetical protein
MILKRKELSKKDELYIEGEGNDENEMSSMTKLKGNDENE